MERDEVLKIMGLIAVEYGALFEVSPERAKLWHAQLEPLDRDDVERAVMGLLGEDREFPPRIGEVRTSACGVMQRRAQIAAAGGSKVLALPEPHAMNEENRQKCIEMLRECSKKIGEKFK